MTQIGSTSPLLLLVLFMINFTPALNGFACLSSPCIHGICVDDLNSTFFCYCIDGYTGFQCQTNWNDCWSSPCQNGGICIDGIATFNCTCPPGFVGDLCEEDFNECDSNPCWNNGTCIDAPNGYICKCLPGYSGVHCEIDVAVCNATGETRCFNGGVCLEGPGEAFSCQCQAGWDGFLCDSEIDECMSAPCQNGAVCIDQHADYECACLFGYTGRNCEEVMRVCTENPCRNGALCLIENNQSICYCVPDFHGEFCELQYDECQLGSRCLNGGTCIDGVDNFTCSCPSDLTGVLCECLILSEKEMDCSYKATSVSTASTSTSTSPASPGTSTSTAQSTSITSTTTSPTTSTTTTVISTTSTSISTARTPPVTKPIAKTTHTDSTTTEGITSSITFIPTELSAITELYEVPNLSLSTTSTYESTTDNTRFHIPPTGLTTEVNIYETTTSVSINSEGTSESFIDSTTNSTELLLDNGTDIFSSSTTIRFEKTLERATDEPSSIASSETEETFTEIISTVTPSTSITDQSMAESTDIPNAPRFSNDSEVSYEGTAATDAGTSSSTTFNAEKYSTTIPTTDMVTITDSTIVEISSAVYSTSEASRNVGRTIPSTIDVTTTSLKTSDSTHSSTAFSESISSTSPTFITEPPSVSTFLAEESPTTIGTTWSSLQATTEAFVDCTVPEQQCQNGGTCIYANDQHQCACPFDAEGVNCEIKLGIKDAAFTGNSFLSHHLKNLQNITVEFTIKTFSDSGVLFYAMHDKTYMTLYIKDGYLVFKFSCGYQTMMLSELKMPVNNGFKLRIKANLEYAPTLTHCNASIQINNTLSMAGDQVARFDQFALSSAWLYLGNLPVGSPFVTNTPVGGFTGCMSDLRISERKIYIYKDAVDGYEITECSSLACLSNPCQNGGSCTSTKDSWMCHCKNGYLGTMCELTVCDNNPCLYGGTCVPFSNSGYICLCPFGKHGHFCENDLKITEPYFSSTIHGLSSFAAYPLPNGISEQLEIQFRFIPTTLEQISLLLFIGQNKQHDFFSDHLAVSFVKGYILLTWNMGSGPRRIFTSAPIEAGAIDYLVKLGYRGRRAWLFVDNLGNVTGRSPGNAAQLDTVPLLYLGGHDSMNFSKLPHDLPFHTGFSGCIFNVEIKSGNIVLPLQGVLSTIGRAVGQCGTTECYEQSCQNDGACVHHGNTFLCLCQDSWYGPLCSSQQNVCENNITKCSPKSRCVPQLADYECDCALGRSGRYCEKEENISDVSFTGRRSFLHIRDFEINSSKFNVEMELRILKDTGIVFFIGSKEASFICLNLQNGLLELKLYSGKIRKNIKDPVTVRSSKLLLKGTWHKIQFGTYGRKIYLYVDRVINMEVLDHGFMLDLIGRSIYLGGLPDLSELPMFATSNFPTPYTGCLRHLAIDNRKFSLLEANDDIIEARNVVDCDGTPCGGELCSNGGTCWLDSSMKPHCSCIPPYYGNKCEALPECTENTCKNGQCRNSTCLCYAGFEGGLCENKIEMLKTPSFAGSSYLIVRKPNEKKRNIREKTLKTLYLNFTTASNDGLLIWSRRGKQFIGLGLEKGYLKLVYSLKNSNETIVEIPPYYKLADGLWHCLEITFLPFSMKIDNRTLHLTRRKNFTQDFQISQHQLFFIGGVPLNLNLMDETSGLFHESFEGCIQAFGIEPDQIITDFTPFEGLNINLCKFI